MPLLEEGDIVIDAGNAHFPDTIRRENEAEAEMGLHFVGTGVSGGEEGALNGPSIMPGGSRESYESLGPLLESISAKVDGTPCCTYVGPDGAGHFVKMVHNGIEYADMQLIAEAYDLIKQGTGAVGRGDRRDLHDLERGRSRVVPDRDHRRGARPTPTPRPAGRSSTSILDQAEQKGTGRWTVQNALDLGVPITGIAEATFARALSGSVPQREAARAMLPGARGGVDGQRPRRLRRGRPAGAVRVQGRRLLPGLRPDRGGQRGVRLEHRPRGDGADLARRLHHPGPVPEPDHRGVRARRPTCRCCSPTTTSPTPSATAWPAWRRVVAGRRAERHPDAGVLLVAGLLRRHPRRAAAGGPDPGAARLLRRAHLPPGRQAGHLPHRVERRPERVDVWMPARPRRCRRSRPRRLTRPLPEVTSRARRCRRLGRGRGWRAAELRPTGPREAAATS